MDVTITTLRAELAHWVARARAGEEVLVTERGVPVARLLPVQTGSIIERLTREGLLSRPPRSSRPMATGRRRARARGPVSELVSEQRR